MDPSNSAEKFNIKRGLIRLITKNYLSAKNKID